MRYFVVRLKKSLFLREPYVTLRAGGEWAEVYGALLLEILALIGRFWKLDSYEAMQRLKRSLEERFVLEEELAGIHAGMNPHSDEAEVAYAWRKTRTGEILQQLGAGEVHRQWIQPTQPMKAP